MWFRDTYIYSFSNSFPTYIVTQYWAKFPRLYSRSLLVTRSFNIYYWIGWWETETLNLCSSENILILPPVLKKNISGYKILCWYLVVFFPQQFVFYSIFFSFTWFLRSHMSFLSLFIGKLFSLSGFLSGFF